LWHILVDDKDLVLKVKFYQTDSGNEPVRNWLKRLDPDVRRVIGEDIKAVQFGWPLGMPLVRKLEPDLWEVRSSIRNGIARVFFTTLDGYMVLLHAFVKQAQKTPPNELETARRRLSHVQREDSDYE